MKVIHKEKIQTVHFQHSIWRNQLAFYKEELNLFQKYLEEVASKNTDNECHIKIEQFQNKFIIQRNELDKLAHQINVIENEASRIGKLHIRRINYEATEQYIDLRDAMVQFEKIYKELRTDFFIFLTKWM